MRATFKSNYKFIILILAFAVSANSILFASSTLQKDSSVRNDINIFVDRAAKLTRLCEGALKEGSYLDKATQQNVLASNIRLRHVYHFWNLFELYTKDLYKLSKKYDIPLIKQSIRNVKKNFTVYLLSIAAKLAYLVNVSEVVNFVSDRPKLNLILNEPNREFNFKKNSLKNNVNNAISIKTIATLYRFKLSFLEVMNDVFNSKSHSNARSRNFFILYKYIAFHDYLLKHLIKNVANKPEWKFFSRSILKSSSNLIYPAQKAIFTWVGDERINHKKSRLISMRQLRKLRKLLKPGDIILERQNWYLSDLFLPGFWPHAIIYIGNKRKLNNFFKSDIEVQKWIRKYNCKSFVDFLEKQFPKATLSYLSNKGVNGHEYGHGNELIEAISEGVVFNPIEESCNADYLAVLRPNLNKIEIAKAIFQAFHYFGREYDFKFNFESEQTLVCTELVSKSYTLGNNSGLRFRYSKKLGSYGVTADSILEAFAKPSNPQNPQLSFVAFLLGIPEKRKAIFSTPKVLNNTLNWKGGLTPTIK